MFRTSKLSRLPCDNILYFNIDLNHQIIINAKFQTFIKQSFYCSFIIHNYRFILSYKMIPQNHIHLMLNILYNTSKYIKLILDNNI